MRVHGFNMRGEFKGERVPTLPVWSSSDEGREIYVEDEGKKYYGNNSEWVDYSIAEQSTLTESYIQTLPFENKLPDNGRFGGTAAGLTITLDDDTDPFASEGFFVPYNSGSIGQVGKFIHNNDDYGGSAGSMTQTTIDLLTANNRVSLGQARYGVEFRIAGITAGSGTAASQSFPGGTRYLMCTLGQYALISFSDYITFCGWVRAIDGTIGIGAGVSCYYFSVDGVEQELTNYDLSTASGWVFIIFIGGNKRGYDNTIHRFYGNDGNVIQVALPAIFNGYLKDIQPFYCPIVSNV